MSDPRTWELRPRCLVVVPGLTFEEFAEGPWASVRGIHGSVNFWLGDAILAAEREFGERASQLYDRDLRPERIDQLRWVAAAIPPARRREDCSWTMHRLVAGLFGRKGGGRYAGVYLDRKAEHQDDLLARAAAEGWDSERMREAIAALETEARNYRGNSGDEAPATPESVAALALPPPESEAAVAPAVPGSEAAIADPEAIREAIEAVRRLGAETPIRLADAFRVGDRIAAALGLPSFDRPPTADLNVALSLFPPGWRRRIEEEQDGDGVTVKWTVEARRGNRKLVIGIARDLGCALVEAALAARLSDLPTTGALPAPRQPESGLEDRYLALPPSERARVRDWLIRGRFVGDHAPASGFTDAWLSAPDEEQRRFTTRLVFGAPGEA